MRAILLLAALAAAGPGARAEEPAAKPGAEYVGAETCLSCHSERESFKKNIHALAWPKAKGIEFSKSCETCHGPGSLHAGAGGDKNNGDFWSIRNPSRLKGAKGSETCLKCHSGGKRMHWEGSTHDVKNVSCQSCHSIHDEETNQGKSPLLRKASREDTCFQCHADKKAQIRKSAHMPIEEGKMSCTSCHNPHGSPEDKLMAKNSVNETCYQCHQDKRGPFLWEHPPAREDCRDCHNPHGSHNDRMLISKVPLLCQRCHIARQHPSSIYDMTTVNAQNVHVQNRGCLNCHPKIHGTNHPSGKRFTR